MRLTLKQALAYGYTDSDKWAGPDQICRKTDAHIAAWYVGAYFARIGAPMPKHVVKARRKARVKPAMMQRPTRSHVIIADGVSYVTRPCNVGTEVCLAAFYWESN